jgi:hypothetical protein
MVMGGRQPAKTANLDQSGGTRAGAARYGWPEGEM